MKCEQHECLHCGEQWETPERCPHGSLKAHPVAMPIDNVRFPLETLWCPGPLKIKPLSEASFDDPDGQPYSTVSSPLDTQSALTVEDQERDGSKSSPSRLSRPSTDDTDEQEGP